MLFSRAVSNLLENAVALHATWRRDHRHGHAGKRQHQHHHQDNGPGIPAEHLARVFDRFYRVDSSRSSHGTGLGLALVRSIMELHGGQASVHSETGDGTAVTLTFPRG
jgi:two-component system heavy metal sensor histidine kinase CusS